MSMQQVPKLLPYSFLIDLLVRFCFQLIVQINFPLLFTSSCQTRFNLRKLHKLKMFNLSN